jgi:hypothetical protein
VATELLGVWLFNRTWNELLPQLWRKDGGQTMTNLITEARGLLGVITADIADDGFFECRAAERDTIKRLCDALEKAETEIEPPTNADKIRNMTDEELAEELWRFWIEFETEKIICNDRSCEDVEAGFDKKCLQCILDWLRQPAETEGGIR